MFRYTNTFTHTYTGMCRNGDSPSMLMAQCDLEHRFPVQTGMASSGLSMLL